MFLGNIRLLVFFNQLCIEFCNVWLFCLVAVGIQLSLFQMLLDSCILLRLDLDNFLVRMD